MQRAWQSLVQRAKRKWRDADAGPAAVMGAVKDLSWKGVGKRAVEGALKAIHGKDEAAAVATTTTAAATTTAAVAVAVAGGVGTEVEPMCVSTHTVPAAQPSALPGALATPSLLNSDSSSSVKGCGMDTDSETTASWTYSNKMAVGAVEAVMAVPIMFPLFSLSFILSHAA
jgi:hypothetical protein